jgi:translocation and assembly module TamB
LKHKDAIEAQIEIPTLAVNYRNAVQIGAPQPIRMDYRNGVLQVERSAIRGTGTDLQFQGRLPVLKSDAPMSLLLQGTMDLRLAGVLNPDLEASGQLVFDINSFGNRTDPNVQGQIRIVDASVATPDMPLGLQNGNGVVTVTRERLEVTRFEGTVGGGKVQASGGVRYRPEVNFDLALVADGIRLLYPEGLRSGVGGNVTLTGTRETAYLRGQLNVEQISFTSDFDLMEMMGSFGGTTAAPPSQGFSNNVQLELSVRSPQGINLVSRELSLQGGMNLNVSGTAAQPVVLGRVSLNSGDLIFRGNRYLLQNATVDFLNPTRTEAVLNASVETTVEQYNIAMRFQGPVDRLRTSYTSDPALPPADIINLLAFGQTTEAAAANPNVPGQLGAQSAIASAVAGQVTSRLEKVAGISHLSIDPTLGGTGSSSQSGVGATVTVQQRVTSKLFVTFSTDVTSIERQVIQLEYRVSPRFSFSGTRDQNGGFAFDTRFRRRW